MNLSWKTMESEWRKELLASAKGNILEVGVGTGNNFEFYPRGVMVTATDASAKVIEKAKVSANKNKVNANFIVSTIEDLNLQKNSFDTIVSTFSLSAFDNPDEVLDKYNSFCKTGGSVLLMEYGLSKFDLVNWIQKKWSRYHYKKTGSHINRDILSIISGSKLKLKKVNVKYAGMVYLVWASLETC